MSKEYKRQWRKRLKYERDILFSNSSSNEVEEDVDLQEQIICDEGCIPNNVQSSEELNDSDQFNDPEGLNYAETYSSSISDSSLLAISGSESSEASNKSGTEVLATDLATWAAKNGLTRSALTELLSILRSHGQSDLPKDARTLMKTPRCVTVISKCGGDYIFLGMKNEILKMFERKKATSLNIILNVNIDGCPLFKSSGVSLWPILGFIVNYQPSNPFPIALFSGKGKPNNCSEFLKDFLDEYVVLEKEGILFENQNYNVRIQALVCDAPARQYLKCVKAHNAYHGCERCEVEGESIEHRMIFSSTEEPLRVSANFNALLYPLHQNDQSPFIETSIDCLANFPLDYMHLVLLGTVKRILLYLMEGPRICRISRRQITEISERLISYQNKIPSELARQPRGLDEMKRWKATEFRQFLLFTGPVVLKGIVKDGVFSHFLTLNVAMRIFLESNDNDRSGKLEYAHQLLKYFVQKSPELYGNTFVTYNIHSLIHLYEDVLKYKMSLDSISCFPFENYLQTLKKYVKKPTNPIAQIFRRREEIDIANAACVNKEFFTHLKANDKDGWFLLKNGNIVKLLAELKDKEMRCEVYSHKNLHEFFTEPCKSSLVKMFKIYDNTIKSLKIIDRKELVRKMVCLQPNTHTTILISLLHNVKLD